MEATNHIGYLLQHLAGVLARQNDQALQDQLGIGFSQFKILRALQHSSRIQQRQIADWLGQTEASISRQIKIMMDKGLLQTSVNPQNRREHLTTLTAKGQRLTDECMRVLSDIHHHVFEGLGAKKQSQLLSALAEMHQHACQPGRPGACNHPFNT